MIINENKKPVRATLVAALILAVCGGYLYHIGYGGIALFMSATCAVSALFCLKKMFSKKHIEITDDALKIVINERECEFKFADIKNINVKTFTAGKKQVKLLNFEFKRALDLDDTYNFLHFYTDKEATMPDIYETSIYEINKILRAKIGFENESEEPSANSKKHGKRK
ncbi:MAG: hypothetical protein J6M14_07835 [Campylobacter sp.]|nr:hypothetical protein [Campylobacter sp.]